MTCTEATTGANPTVDNCNTGTIGNAEVNQVGTCTAGNCAYVSACSANADCIASNSCSIASGATTGTCLASCTLNTDCATSAQCTSNVCAAACTMPSASGVTPVVVDSCTTVAA